jgi:hypothetical protein
VKTNDFIDTDLGPIEIIGPARLLKDEVIGKLVHNNILVSMQAVGFTPVALSASPKQDGSLLVFYAVRLSAEELAALPSIYDPLPKVVRPKPKKAGVRRKAGKMARSITGRRTYRRPK